MIIIANSNVKMKKTIALGIVLPMLVLLSTKCSTFAQEGYFDLKSIESDFLYPHTITTFNVDSISNFLTIVSSNMKKPRPILNDLHHAVFQKPTDIESIVTEYTYYLYNIQSIGKYKSITLIGTSQDWVDEIILLTYTKEGKLVARNTLAQNGGDQEYFVKSESTFTSA